MHCAQTSYTSLQPIITTILFNTFIHVDLAGLQRIMEQVNSGTINEEQIFQYCQATCSERNRYSSRNRDRSTVTDSSVCIASWTSYMHLVPFCDWFHRPVSVGSFSYDSPPLIVHEIIGNPEKEDHVLTGKEKALRSLNLKASVRETGLEPDPAL